MKTPSARGTRPAALRSVVHHGPHLFPHALDRTARLELLSHNLGLVGERIGGTLAGPQLCEVAEKLFEACSPALIEHQDLQCARKVRGKLGVGGVPLSTGEPMPTLQDLLGGGSVVAKGPVTKWRRPSRERRSARTNLGNPRALLERSFWFDEPWPRRRCCKRLVRAPRHARPRAQSGWARNDPQPAAAVMLQICRHPEHPKNVSTTVARIEWPKPGATRCSGKPTLGSKETLQRGKDPSCPNRAEEWRVRRGGRRKR